MKSVTDLILANPSIEFVGDVQSQWVGPASFSFKAEVDFDGTYLAASLQPRYELTTFAVATSVGVVTSAGVGAQVSVLFARRRPACRVVATCVTLNALLCTMGGRGFVTMHDGTYERL